MHVQNNRDRRGGTLTSIAVAGDTPEQVKYGYKFTNADLAGLTFTANYSDSSKTEGNAVTADMLVYDFTELGETDVTVTYNGVSTSFTVTVVDYAVSLAVTVAQGAKLVYNATAAPDFSTVCAFEVTLASGAKQTVTDVTAKSYASGNVYVTFEYTCVETVEATAETPIEIWYEINSVEDWNKISDNLSGYYVLGGDLDFGGAYRVIGQVPLTTVSGDTCLDTSDGNGTVQAGIAFTGKFDGAGHKISNFVVTGYEGGWNQSYVGVAPFAYVGDGASVYDFTLSSSAIVSCNYSAFVAVYNRGNISGITISSDCSISSYYGSAAAIAVANYGTFSDCIGYLTQYIKSNTDTVCDMQVVWDEYSSGTISECYLFGTTLSLDGTVGFTVRYYAAEAGEYDALFWDWGNKEGYDAVADTLTATWIGYNSLYNLYEWKVTLNPEKDMGYEVGESFTFGFTPKNGVDYKSFTVTIVEGASQEGA